MQDSKVMGGETTVILEFKYAPVTMEDIECSGLGDYLPLGQLIGQEVVVRAGPVMRSGELIRIGDYDFGIRVITP